MNIISRLTAPYDRLTTVGGVTLGLVVDVNDPQQQGRIRVSCPALNDVSPSTENFNVQLIPWAIFAPLFSGSSSSEARGPDGNTSVGSVAYGEWARPNVGSTALIACIDGDAQFRVCIGVIPNQYLAHTMPHGRYIVEDGALDGPFTSEESPINPLYDNITATFGGRNNFEWLTRGADHQASRVNEVALDRTSSSIPDSVNVDITLPDGSTRTINQGYVDGKSKVFAWTTPGFHSMVMDDDPDNCRIRLRTTTGHQILLDDTNERIFVGTNEGKTWHEIDAKGNIDTHSDLRISYHSNSDINVMAEKHVRLHGREGIHFVTEGEIRMHAGNDIHIRSDSNIRFYSDAETKFESVADFTVYTAANMNTKSDVDTNVYAGGALNMQAAAAINEKAGAAFNLEAGAGGNIKSAAAMNIEAGATMNLLAGPSILTTAAAVHLNGPPAAPASSAGTATQAATSSTLYAYAPSRVPFKLSNDNLPWARVSVNPSLSDNDSSTNLNIDYLDYGSLEYSYTDPNCNSLDLGTDLARGTRWKR